MIYMQFFTHLYLDFFSYLTIVTGDIDVARWTGGQGSLLCSTMGFVTFALSKVRHCLRKGSMTEPIICGSGHNRLIYGSVRL